MLFFVIWTVFGVISSLKLLVLLDYRVQDTFTASLLLVLSFSSFVVIPFTIIVKMLSGTTFLFLHHCCVGTGTN